MTASVAQVRSGFAALRTVCDPRGYDLIDALEETCVFAVVGCDTLAMALERVREWDVSPPNNAFGQPIGGDAA